MERKVLQLPRDKIVEFCRRWKIVDFALFGSVLREDFRATSDVDVLATFAPDADWSLFDHVVMEDELASVLGRNVDLVNRRAVETSSNWIRRERILSTAETYYAAGC